MATTANQTVGFNAYNAWVEAHANVAHHWRLDEASGNWLDQVGSIDITVNGSPTRGAAHTHFGDRAVTFDGAADYGSSVTGITPALDASFSVWFKTSSTGTVAAFEAGADASNNMGLWVVSDYFYAYFEVAGIGYTSRSPKSTYSDDAWHLADYTVNSGGTTRKLYMDGVNVGSDNAGTLSSPSGVGIGGRNSGGFYWPGSLGPVTHFTSELTEIEIAQKYERATFQSWGTAPDVYGGTLAATSALTPALSASVDIP